MLTRTIRDVLTAGAVAVAVLFAGAAPATASLTTYERVVLPPGGTVTIAGHGFGHGHGMSQWGARSAAAQGVGYQRILDFYYPGTTSVTQTNQNIAVLVSADSDNDVRVLASPGMTVTDSVNGTRPIGFPGLTVTQWRIVREAAGLSLDGLVAGTWKRLTTVPSVSFLSLASPSGTARLILPNGTQKEYRGAIRAVADGAVPRLRTVNVVPMEDYLRAVVPAESPSSWPADALRAQAVAARTYASQQRAGNPGGAWQTCDTTACQVYPGYRTYSAGGALTTTHEAASTDTAVAGTANQVRHFAGALAFTQFSSSSGGWTSAGSAPYLVAQPDPWDATGNPVHLWSVRLTVQSIANAYGQVGTPRTIEVRTRSGNGEWGGRVVSVTITGSGGAVTLTGAGFRSAFGLRSDWWTVTASTRLDSDFTTNGRADILAVTTSGALIAYEANGTGGFGAARQVGNGWSAMRLAIRANDLNGDGKPDLLAVDGNGVLWRYPGVGGGGFGERTRVGSNWYSIMSLVAPGDLNGDGNADLLAVDSTGRMWFYPGNGDGTISDGRSVGTGWATMTAVLGAGDWDDDGRADLVARDAGGRLLIYRGNGSGGFTSTQIGNGWGSMRLLSIVGDWVQDGRPDVLAVAPSGALIRYPWTGPNFGTPVTIGSGWGGISRIL
ncbi:SpoIID/LytB domain-containing protein [Oerskovia sp. Root22]|uniref:SpoIID/LytB domain-containing protein n=1 Tax=Oerskovia sp. Root22 TaxID=1736494 RepID=UPI0006F1E5D4|nr:SpoIID/LytB domain-containing protein [Oerskovia sp. Root22]KRC34186.1 hypothetical protein ASE15_13485 [Oerskovia sp. Root22]